MTKDLDDLKPVTRTKWKDSLLMIEKAKPGEWLHIRIVGGVYSYGSHWVDFQGKDGTKKGYAVECTNYSADTEKADQDGGCPCCELGMKVTTKYMLNVIDRRIQRTMKSDTNPIRVLELPPGAMNNIIGLKQLNLVDDVPTSVSNAKAGCDIAIQLAKNNNKSEWRTSLGKTTPLTKTELEYELFDCESAFIVPDNAETRRSLIQKGYKFTSNETSEQEMETSERTEEVKMPSPKKPATKEVEPEEYTQEVVTDTDDSEELDSVDDVKVEEEEEVKAPEPAPKETKKKLAAPPVPTAKKEGEIPKCFADGANGNKFLRGVKCLKCPWKVDCSANTNKM